MTEEVNLENLKYVNSGGPTNEELNKIDGTKVKIKSANIIKDTSKFGKDGETLPEGQEREVYKIELESEPFGQDLIGRDITHKERYNLVEKNGEWIVSLHEKSKTAQFLAKYGKDRFENVPGTEVILVKKTNANTGRSYLRIAI